MLLYLLTLLVNLWLTDLLYVRKQLFPMTRTVTVSYSMAHFNDSMRESHMTETSDRVTETPDSVTETSDRVAETPDSVTETPGRVTETPGRLTETPGRVTEWSIPGWPPQDLRKLGQYLQQTEKSKPLLVHRRITSVKW